MASLAMCQLILRPLLSSSCLVHTLWLYFFCVESAVTKKSKRGRPRKVTSTSPETRKSPKRLRSGSVRSPNLSASPYTRKRRRKNQIVETDSESLIISPRRLTLRSAASETIPADHSSTHYRLAQSSSPSEPSQTSKPTRKPSRLSQPCPKPSPPSKPSKASELTRPSKTSKLSHPSQSSKPSQPSQPSPNPSQSQTAKACELSQPSKAFHHSQPFQASPGGQIALRSAKLVSLSRVAPDSHVSSKGRSLLRSATVKNLESETQTITLVRTCFLQSVRVLSCGNQHDTTQHSKLSTEQHSTASQHHSTASQHSTGSTMQHSTGHQGTARYSTTQRNTKARCDTAAYFLPSTAQ